MSNLRPFSWTNGCSLGQLKFLPEGMIVPNKKKVEVVPWGNLNSFSLGTWLSLGERPTSLKNNELSTGRLYFSPRPHHMFSFWNCCVRNNLVLQAFHFLVVGVLGVINCLHNLFCNLLKFTPSNFWLFWLGFWDVNDYFYSLTSYSSLLPTSLWFSCC